MKRGSFVEMKDKGFALLYVLFITMVFIIISTMLTRIIFSSSTSLYVEREALEAYYLAEAGIEYGKAQLPKNPAWCTPGTKVITRSGYFIIKRKPNDAIISSAGYVNHSQAMIRFDIASEKQTEEIND